MCSAEPREAHADIAGALRATSRPFCRRAGHAKHAPRGGEPLRYSYYSTIVLSVGRPLHRCVTYTTESLPAASYSVLARTNIET